MRKDVMIEWIVITLVLDDVMVTKNHIPLEGNSLVKD